jgi:hypothetical protein
MFASPEMPGRHGQAGARQPCCWNISLAIRGWADCLPDLRSDIPVLSGGPLPFDRSRIFPYAFRHSYA